MNNIKHTIFALCIAACAAAFPVQAQNALPDDAHPMIVIPHLQSVDYKERTICFDIKANVSYDIASSADWATFRKGTDGTVYVHLSQNLYSEARTASITFTNTEKGVSQTLTISQAADGSAAELPTSRIYPTSATASSTQNGEGIEYSYDDNTSTLYHSSYSGGVSASNPVTLTYNFTGIDSINSVTYVPRQSGTNGIFLKTEVYAKTKGEAEKLVGTYEWGATNDSKTIDFGPGGIVNPEYIKFKVLSGSGGFASCAEMKFERSIANDPEMLEFGIFADSLYTTLKEGTTQADINHLTNPFVKSLATKIFNKEYDTNYRVAEFPCLLSVQALADLWNCPGKYYDQTPGVTGLTYGPGTYIVVVSGLPSGQKATLKFVAWYNGIIGSNFDGGNPQETDYTLSNGVNVIKYDPANTITYKAPYVSDYDALAYIDYHVDANPEKMPAIKVHFVNATVNGYLSHDKTNDEMHEITGNAKNWCMDVVGNKMHAVWTAKGLHDYCRDINGNQKGYRQYINVMDSLVQWEHDLLGFTKYNRLPKNRTFAYVNYTYYMFQGGRGVSFIYSQEPRVLNCKTICTSDDDAIWGLSHEWGHQHQIHPYFCWRGMGEVTNNMNSYYNIMKMGYRTSDKINNWAPARKHFVKDDLSGVTNPSTARKNAYDNASSMQWNEDYYNLCLEMKDNTIPTQAENKVKGLGNSEVGNGETLCPFIMLFSYFTQNGFPDFAPDWYEAIRQTDQEGGSTIEKKGGYDKYELVAAAQNNDKNGAIAKLNELFPGSVWCKYITTAHHGQYDNNMPYILNYIRKVSRLSGYNLFPYFETWGFLRQTAIRIDDYGTGWQIFPKAAYDEFKADMDALVADGTLKEMPEGMVESISNAPELFMTRPTFPN